ncbi:hypothetical protein [Halorhabdus sp. BNX81]|uniref:hypothetical protein n=1 Tax=Halorhabdus sp. BNX81 TaxID=2980181 RepID=UPI0023DD1C4B|nr:hypothetical protein [Halorhabdus sp. BNX81]
MDAAVIGDLVAPARRSDDLAYRVVGDRARSHSYDSVCATAWKTANLLRLYGVHDGSIVGVVDAPKHPDYEPGTPPSRTEDTPIPEVIFALLGAALLGATVRFDPPRDLEADALVGPAAWMDDYEPGPASTSIAYGGPPENPSIVHFETEVWSETPIAPPETVSPDTPLLITDDRQFDHRTLVEAAEAFLDQASLTAADSVAIDSTLSEPGTVVGGVLAPLLAGGTMLVGTDDETVRIGADGIDPRSISIGNS